MLTRTAIINKGVERCIHCAAAEIAVNADGFHALIEADILRAVAGRGVVGGGQRLSAGERFARTVQITAVVLKPRERSVRGRADLIKLADGISFSETCKHRMFPLHNVDGRSEVSSRLIHVGKAVAHAHERRDRAQQCHGKIRHALLAPLLHAREQAADLIGSASFCPDA